MKRILGLPISFAVLLLAAPPASEAAIFFSDTFSNGSTLNSLTPADPTATNTSYQIISSKTWVPAPSISSGHLQFGIASTTGGTIETQARFGTNVVSLVEPNDYIQLSFTFTNTAGILTANGGLGFGLYNSSGVQPIAGGLNGTALDTVTTAATGGAAGWKGYVSVIQFTGNASRMMDRLPQTGTGNNNQDLVTVGSSSQSYRNPQPVSLSGSQGTAPSTNLTVGGQYTAILKFTLTSTNTLLVDSRLYIGADSAGTLISSNSAVTASPPNTAVFDGFAIGWRAQAATTGGTVIDINSIKVEGVSTVVTSPPDIITQPVPVAVPNGASCAFSVGASGFGMTYQWKRSNTNLLNGGNISGATSDMLVISPASAADVASGGNGYYVTVTGTGGYSTNSTTNSLSLRTATPLTWNAASGPVWDLNSTASWQDPGANTTVFNYGDPVTFDDTATVRIITLTGRYLSAASVTVNNSLLYQFRPISTGSFAGPGQLIYKGSGQLTIGNVNTYSGGTIISNATAWLRLENYAGLGSGPVTLAKAGGTMEVVPNGSASVGILGDINVADDFTIQFDADGNFTGVFFGNLTGTAGKVLTFNPNPSITTTNQRVRVYGTNTTYDANLLLNSPVITLAPYQPNGSQNYNGIISGPGGLIQRGSSITILNGQNTYSGGSTPTTGTIGFGADSTPTSGTVTSGPIGTGPLLIAPEVPNITGSGTVLAWNGARTIANPLQYPSATNNQTLIIGGTNALTFSGPVTLNGNDSLGTLTNRIFQVTNTALTTISGVISGTGFGLTKTGNGILALSNTETYTGPTAISNGTLRVNGQLDVGAVTVATNATLGGSGTIPGPVTVLAGGNLAPGNSIGTLTINNNLTLSGNLAIEVNNTNSTTSDKAVVSGTLTNAGTGTVTVANLGPPLVPGNSFTLFNKALTNGNALTITGGQVVWTNKLALDGTIEVVTSIATTPTNISYSLSGNTLTLSWPQNYLTWSLQSNFVGLASSTNWFTVPNSANSTQFPITINPARSNVFYRMIAP